MKPELAINKQLFCRTCDQHTLHVRMEWKPTSIGRFVLPCVSSLAISHSQISGPKKDKHFWEEFLQMNRRVSPFYPAGGCFGGQSVFNISWDVSRGVVRGELVATRRLPDGTVRSYWQYTDSSYKPPLDLRGVLIHDPDAGFMPTQATWHGTYPSRMQTEWE